MRYGGLLDGFIALLPLTWSVWWWHRETTPGRLSEELPMLALLLFMFTLVAISAFLTLRFLHII